MVGERVVATAEGATGAAALAVVSGVEVMVVEAMGQPKP